MSALNRDILPPGEYERIKAVHGHLFDALDSGPKTNKQLSAIGLDYTRGVRSMRKDGLTVDCERLDKGLFQYTLTPDREPEWRVIGVVTLADGSTKQLSISTRAKNVGQAKNRAQHLFAKVKLLDVVALT